MKHLPKKICFFVFFFPKLTETFILNRITGLIDLGYEVEIFATKNGLIDRAKEDIEADKIVHPDVLKYNLLSKTTYFPRDENKLLDSRQIEKELFGKKFDILHFQWSTLAEEVLSKLDLQIATLVSFHETNIPGNWFAPDSGYNYIFSKSDLILAESDFIRKDLIRKGYDGN